MRIHWPLLNLLSWRIWNLLNEAGGRGNKHEKTQNFRPNGSGVIPLVKQYMLVVTFDYFPRKKNKQKFDQNMEFFRKVIMRQVWKWAFTTTWRHYFNSNLNMLLSTCMAQNNLFSLGFCVSRKIFHAPAARSLTYRVVSFFFFFQIGRGTTAWLFSMTSSPFKKWVLKVKVNKVQADIYAVSHLDNLRVQSRLPEPVPSSFNVSLPPEQEPPSLSLLVSFLSLKDNTSFISLP